MLKRLFKPFNMWYDGLREPTRFSFFIITWMATVALSAMPLHLGVPFLVAYILWALSRI